MYIYIYIYNAYIPGPSLLKDLNHNYPLTFCEICKCNVYGSFLFVLYGLYLIHYGLIKNILVF